MSNPKLKIKIKHLLSRFFPVKVTIKRFGHDFKWYSDKIYLEQTFTVLYHSKDRFKLKYDPTHLITITDVK